MTLHRSLAMSSALSGPYRVLLLSLAVCAPSVAMANPQDGVVASGQASMVESGNRLDIHQQSSRVVIDWRSFDIAPDEITQFHQPDSSSIALNRVNNSNPTQIMGQLTANGNVVIVNPNGVFFGKDSKVDVNGIIATTADTTNADFMNGQMKFDKAGSSTASVINEGTITAKDAGLVGFVAPNVSNSGTITARLGKVQLSSGDSFTMDMYGDGLMEVKVSDDVQQQLVSNSGVINAQGGRIALTAAAGRGVINSLINNTGELYAPTFSQKNGRIIISGEGDSTVMVSGVVETVNRDDGKGGDIEIVGEHVAIRRSARVSASGKHGGGKIRIGGGYLGMDTDIRNASRTIVQEGALIESNALTVGSGGTVIVWSDDRTDFGGLIEARGGSISGDGGFVETSGKNILSSTGLVDASATDGKAGLWLLDPNNITIQASGSNTNVTGDPNFTTTDDNAIVTVSSIQTALNAGTSVTILTSSLGANTQGGDITVASSIAKTGGGDASLTLSAHRNIYINDNANITSTSNRLNLTLRADNADNSSGFIYIGGSTINTNGGNITMGGGSGAITAGSGYAWGNSGQASGIRTQWNTSINAAGGNIIMNGKGWTGGTNTSNAHGIFNEGTIATNGTGTITLYGEGGGSGTGSNNVGVRNSNSISSVDGDITLNGISSFGSNSNGGGVYHADNTISSLGNGSINITSTSNVTGTGGWNPGGRIDAVISATNGNININSTHANASYGDNMGLLMQNGNISIAAGGTGNISVTGTTAATWDSSASGIKIANGTIAARSGTTSVSSNGTLRFESSNVNIGGVNTTGNITLTQDLLSLVASTTNNIQTTGDITVRTRTVGRGMSVGASVASTLNVSTTALGYFNWGGTLNLGDATNTGTMTINTANAFTKKVAFTNASGYDMTLQTTNLTTNYNGTGNAFAFYAGQDLNMNRSVTNTATSGTSSMLFSANRHITWANTYGISGSGVGINMTMTADADNNTIGQASLGTGTFNANGGNIVISGRNSGWQSVSVSGSVLTSGAGTIDITGYGTTGYSGSFTNFAYGVNLASSSSITSGSGNINITGTGNAGSTDYATGIYSAGSVSSTSGSINMIGTGGAGGSTGAWQNVGIRVAGGTISTGGTGNILLQGTAGSRSSGVTGELHGVFISAGSITNSGSGTLTIDGTAGTGADWGVSGTYITTSGTISTQSGALSIRGTSRENNWVNSGIYLSAVNISSTSGAITLTGIKAGTSNTDLTTTGTVSIGNGTTQAGNISLVVDSWNLSSGTTIRTSGDINLNPYTTGYGMSVGTSVASTLNVSNTYLGYLNWGTSGTLNLGDATKTGTMTIDTSNAFAKKVSFTNASGYNMTLQNTDLSSSYSGSGNAVAFSSGGTLSLARSVSNSGTGALSMQADTLSLTASRTYTTLGDITISAYTAGRGMSIGTSVASTLNVSNTYLGQLSWGSSSTLNLGDATRTGTMTIDTSTAFTKKVSFTNASGYDMTLQNTNLTTNYNGSGNAFAFYAGRDLNVNRSVTDTATSGTANMLFAANRAVLLAGSRSISGSGVMMNTTMAADYDNNSDGYINFGTWASIISNGGNITLGGGSGAITAGSGYAWGNSTQASGIQFSNNAYLNATGTSAGGNIVINGRGWNGGTDTSGANGIYYAPASGTTQTSHTGTVTLNGIAGGTGTGAGNYGILNQGNTFTVVDGALSMTGVGGVGNWSSGISFDGSNASITSNGLGSITLIGTNAVSTGSNTRGIYMAFQNSIMGRDGDITISGTYSASGTNGNEGVAFNTSTVGITAGGVGNITINATSNTWAFNNYNTTNIYTRSGNIAVNANAPSNAFGNAGALTLGGANTTGNITVTADSWNVGSGGIMQTTGDINVRTATVGRGMSVGASVASTLNISNTALGNLNWGTNGTLNLGDATNTGTMTIDTSNAFTKRVSFTNASGYDMTLQNTNLTTNYNGSGNAFAFYAGRDLNMNRSVTNTATTGTSNMLFAANRAIIWANSHGVSGSGVGINMTLASDYDNDSDGYIRLNSGSFLSAGGNITLGGGSGAITAGSGYAWGNATQNDGIWLNGTTAINAGGGNIIMNGRGFTGGTNLGSVDGIYSHRSNLSTSGNGTITLNGIGGGSGTGTNNLGVWLSGGSYSVAEGNFTVVGTGGINANSNGINMDTSGSTFALTSGGAGAINLTGSSSGASAPAINLTNISITGMNGDINLVGNSTNHEAVNLNGASITMASGGIGNINITGTGVGWGLRQYNTTTIATRSGNITITGIGGAGIGGQTGTAFTIGGANTTGNISFVADWVMLNSGNSVQTTGDINIRPHTTGYGMSVGTNVASTLNLSNTALGLLNWGTNGTLNLGDSTNTGTMTIDTSNAFTKRVSFTNASGYDMTLQNTNLTTNYNGAGNAFAFYAGRDLNMNRSVTNTATTGTSNMLFTANRAIGWANSIGVSGSGVGINMAFASDYDNNSAGGIYLGTGTFNSAGGNITLGGGSGAITAGSGYAWGTSNNGVFIAGILNAAGGDIVINGRGYAGGVNTANAIGVYMFNSANITTSGNGNISINGIGGGSGSGGGNFGFYNYASTNNVGVSSGNGSVSITGVTGVNTGTGVYFASNGSAGLGVTSTGGAVSLISDSDLAITSWSFTIGGGSGNVTLQANTLNPTTGLNVQTTGDININPYTAGRGMSVGTNIGSTLNVSNAALGYLNWGGTLTIGETVNTGTVTVNTTHNFTGATAFASRNASGINVTGALTGTGSGSFSFSGPTTLSNNITTANQAITFNSAVTLGANSTLASGSGTTTFGSTVNGGYDLTATAGAFSLAGAWGGTTRLGNVSLTSTSALTLPSITASTLLARTTGATSDLTLGGNLNTNGNNTATTLVSGRNFLNSGNHTITTGGTNGRWLVYSTNPDDNTAGGLTENFRRYSCSYSGSCPTLGTGNGMLYSYTPILTITPNSAGSITYGDAVPSFGSQTYTLSGYRTGDSALDGITGSATYTTNYTQGSGVGGYNVTSQVGTLASAMGYGFTGATTNNALSVTAKALTVTANAASKTYGASDPSLTYGYSGLYSGDTASVFTGALGRAAGENAGTYAIGIGTLSAGANYTISYTGANLTINPYTLTVVANAASKTYGAADPSLTYTYGTLQNGDTASVFTGGLSRAAGENAGTYAIGQGTLSAGSNYSISYTGANLTINKAQLTVTANNASRTYGDANPAFSAIISGFVNGETLATSGVTGAASLTTTADANSSVAGGPYTITAALGSLAAGNYDFTVFNHGSLTINARALTVTTDAKTKAYGAADPTFTGSNNLTAYDAALVSWTYSPNSYSGLPGSYTISALANDTAGRLANYVRVNDYGLLLVTGSVAPALPDMPTTIEWAAQNPATRFGQPSAVRLFTVVENPAHKRPAANANHRSRDNNASPYEIRL